MARELKGLIAGLIAGLGVVGTAYGVSLIASHGQTGTQNKPQSVASGQAPPPAPPTQIIATGRSLYGEACAGCHGKDGAGRIGPTLHGLGDPDAKVAASIKNGFPGQMPGFKSKYTDAQISALVTYVQSFK